MCAVITRLSSFCNALQVIEHLQLRKRHRFKSTVELEAFFAAKDFGNGLEYSYAQKCNIIREQIQLRKKLGGVVKVSGRNATARFVRHKKIPNALAWVVDSVQSDVRKGICPWDSPSREA